jgi:hypothetical protein
MPSFLAFATPLVLLLPILGQGSVSDAGAVPAARLTTQAPISLAPDYEHSPEDSNDAEAPFSPAAGSGTPLGAFYGEQVMRQFRIEQRVVIRISPRQPTPQEEDLLSQLPRQQLNARYEERKMDQCVPISGIAGVQTGSGNRLLLFLRDQRIVTLNLEKACRARDFYSGFYVEQNADGKLCVDRDLLQSRTGAKCEVERMRQLVAVKN